MHVIVSNLNWVPSLLCFIVGHIYLALVYAMSYHDRKNQGILTTDEGENGVFFRYNLMLVVLILIYAFLAYSTDRNKKTKFFKGY